MPYSCTLKGLCEYDDYGDHPDLATCQANCNRYEGELIDDLVYDILALNLDDALELAPSDITIILFRVSGIRSPDVSRSRQLLHDVIDRDYIRLWRQKDIPSVMEYLTSQLEDELDFLLLDTLSDIIVQPEWMALRNRVTRLLSAIFREKDGYYSAFGEQLEEIQVFSLEELVNSLQVYIADTIYLMVVYTENSPRPNMEGFLKHWDYIVERFGPVIPYQRYIGVDEE